MPNIEHAKKTQKYLLEKTHTLIAKTRFGYNLFTDYLKSSTGNVPRIVYIGHSSIDPLFSYGNNPPKQNFTKSFHAYGHAGTKGTVQLINCWLKHPEWPTLTVVGMSNSDQVPWYTFIPKNIKFFDKVDFKEFGILQRESAIHVYPTCREGFGHALNEARGSGALLVTTKYGPMDEFVEEGYSGYLMHYKHTSVENFQLFGAFRPVQVHMVPEGICKTMEKVFKTSIAERRRMGEAGRAGFLADRVFFIEKVKLIKNEALKLFNGQE